MKKILFITHDTSSTGAPLVLLYFLQWLKQHHSEIHSTVLALKGGFLTEEFKKNVDQYIELPKPIKHELTFYQELRKRVRRKLGVMVNRPDLLKNFFKELSEENFNLIYANSIVSVPTANNIKNLSPSSSLIVHAHEMKTIINLSVPAFEKYISNIQYFIAASNLVKKDLERFYGVDHKKIRVIQAFTRIEKHFTRSKKKEFIVGGAGSVHWRKGSDLFIQIAYLIKKKLPYSEIKFQWVGDISQNDKIIIDSDLEKLGLTHTVSFLGLKKDPFPYFSDFDVFLLPSREDPFPLVAIELSSLEKPIICFEKATGIAEVLAKGGGFVVPYMDVPAMAEKVMFYFENEDHLKEHGKMARKLFNKHSPEIMSPLIFDVIKSLS